MNDLLEVNGDAREDAQPRGWFRSAWSATVDCIGGGYKGPDSDVLCDPRPSTPPERKYPAFGCEEVAVETYAEVSQDQDGNLVVHSFGQAVPPKEVAAWLGEVLKGRFRRV